MPRRIAIVRLSAIGDVVHGLPLARSLRRLHPDAEIVWTVQPEPAPLLAGHPWIDRVHVFPRRGGLRAVIGFLLESARTGFDLAVDLQGNLKSALALAATRAPVRAGLARAEYREVPGALAANRHAAPARGPHSVDRTLALCRLLGDPHPEPRYGLAPTSEELETARRRIGPLGSPVVALSVGGHEDVREWTDEGYVRTARSLRERGASVLVLAGPKHADRGRRIASAAGVAERAGTDDLRELLALLKAFGEVEASALVACDSAPVHLATAVGLDVVTLSGPQDPRRTGPYGSVDRAITRWEGLPCAPCRKRRCRLRREPKGCMTRIRPEDVLARLSPLLSA
ncbi:MAG: glycosyltransferase family 9 protein [Planctomycetota bacterium]|jgi:ADP-heptose:LPS heptosyltransferase